jgi:threonine dehydrogenase-like Zn-dependent dehydrogenase
VEGNGNIGIGRVAGAMDESERRLEKQLKLVGMESAVENEVESAASGEAEAERWEKPEVMIDATVVEIEKMGAAEGKGEVKKADWTQEVMKRDLEDDEMW